MNKIREYYKKNIKSYNDDYLKDENFYNRFFKLNDKNEINNLINKYYNLYNLRENKNENLYQIFNDDKNYKKISFQNFHRRKIRDQVNLLLKYNKH